MYIKAFLTYSISCFFFLTVHSQYADLSVLEFQSLSKLDSTIKLGSQFDDNLLRCGILHATNEFRKKHHKTALVENSLLEKTARIHSSQMQVFQFFSHLNKRTKKWKDLEKRAKDVGYQNYKIIGENIYKGFIKLDQKPTYRMLIQTVVEAFIKSKEHKLNMLNTKYEEMGSAIAFDSRSKNKYLYYYFTENFGTIE